MARRKENQDLTRRKDGIWQTTVTRDGVTKYFRSKDPDECRRKREEFLNPPEQVITFARAAEEWRDNYWPTVEAGTQMCYNPAYERARALYGEMEVQKLQAAEISAHLLRLKSQGYGLKTIQTQKQLYNMVLNYSIVKGWRKDNPVPAVQLPANLKSTKREAPDEDVVQLIREHYADDFGLFPFFLLYTGCRRGEAMALEYSDIDWGKRTILINKSVKFVHGKATVGTPKTDSGIRKIPLLDELAEKLDRQGTGLIFPGTNGGLMSDSFYRDRWEKYIRGIGIAKGKLTAHQLRHGYATILYEAGIDAQVAKVLLGHADIETTLQIYTHIRNKKQSSAAGMLNDYFRNL